MILTIKNDIFQIANEMAKEGQNITGQSV